MELGDKVKIIETGTIQGIRHSEVDNATVYEVRFKDGCYAFVHGNQLSSIHRNIKNQRVIYGTNKQDS